MVLLRVLIVLLWASPLTAQSMAEAVLDAAKAAIRVQDYTGALLVLQAPDVQQLPSVLLMQASLYQAGRGVARDDARAYQLTQSAAALGSVDAQYSLGRLLLSGRGVEANREDGQAWVTKAAEAGHIRAAALLVNLLQSPAVVASVAAPPDIIAAPVQGSDISRRLGWTPLMEAAQRGQPKLLEALIPEASLNAQDRQGRTALMLAVSANNMTAVDMLLRAGADPEAVDKTGMTALGFAAQEGDDLIVRILLAAGAWPDLPDLRGQTPLDLAVISNHGTIAALMLNRQELTLADDLLLQLWFSAAKHSTPDLIEALRARGAQCALQDASGLTALDHAAESGNLVMLHYCLPEASPALLVRAVRAGQSDFAMDLLVAGIAPNGTSPSGNTALLIAAHNGNTLLTEALLNRGANVDHRNNAGNSALMLAAENGHDEVITLLLAAGANTSLRNKQREQAHEIASAAGHPELALVLQ